MSRPNILLFMADQLRFDALGCYGNSEIHTPNIDRLAQRGSVFDNHFIQNPVCMPSRATVFTGRYPKNHGTRDNGIPLRDSEITFPEVLRTAGYRTAAIGKMHLTSQFTHKDDEHEDWPADRYGFDTLHTSGDTKTGAYLRWLERESPEDYAIVREQGDRKRKEDIASAAAKDLSGPPQVHPSRVSPERHQTAWIADRTIDFIEEEDERPFFAFCSFVDPHHPFDPPAPYDAMYDPQALSAPSYVEGELDDKPPHFLMHRTGHGFSNEKYDYRRLADEDWRAVKAAYYGMISLIDEHVGRILDTLDKRGLREQTLILFTNDHGELLGDHGLLFKGPFHYDCLIKAPMILSWPGMIPEGARYRQFTEHVDILPTILDYAGAPVPYGAQGMSMAPVLRGDKGAGREYAMTEFNCYDWGLSVRTITGRDYKLTVYAGEEYGELYDRRRDPGELVNRWDDPEYAAIRGRLEKRLLDRVIESEDTLPLRIAKY